MAYLRKRIVEMDMSSLLSQHPSFSAVVGQFAQGKSTPRDFLELCIDAVDRAEPMVKAFVSTDLVRARKLADESTARYRDGCPRSPIDGMPVGVKDIIETADLPTQMNSAIYQGYRPKVDSPAVRALLEGGGIPLGKTVTTEFAIGRSGPTTNPHNTAHTPGGSSSGSAAGVAAGMFAAAFGTQTQGSLIRPAGFCGAVGYKPTFGALSTDGIHPLSRSHDHLGVIADSVDDAWWLARWVGEYAPSQDGPGLSGPIHGAPPASPLRRVAVLRTQGFDDLDAASLKAFEGVLEQLGALGVEVVEPDVDPALGALVERLDPVPAMSLEMVAYDMRWPYMGYLSSSPEHLGPRIHALLEQARGISRERYRELLRYRADLRQRVAMLGEAYDAFVLPSSSGPAPEGFEYTGARTLLVYGSFIGIPAYSLPVMTVGSMPFGLQLAGFANADYRLTRHAQWLMREIRIG